MAAQPDHLFGHGDPLGEDGGFRHNALFVHGGAVQKDVQPLLQLLPVLLHRPGRALLNLAHQAEDGSAARRKVLFQASPFRLAHREERRHGPVHHL